MHTVQLCLGFITANAAAGEAVRMAARARRARQLVGKEILRCYQWILLLCTRCKPEAVRMAARARRARQLVGKEILRCYQWILLLCTRCKPPILACSSNVPCFTANRERRRAAALSCVLYWLYFTLYTTTPRY